MDGNFLTPTALGASPIHGADFISRVLPTWADLSEARRDNIASAVRGLAQKCDMPLQNVQITHAVVHRLIKAALKDCRPVSPNHRSDLQYVINRLCSQGVPPGKAPKDLSPAWQVLFDQIPSKFDQFGLCRFLQYCSRQAILPEHVTSDTLAEFELEQSKTGVLKDAGRLSRSTLAAWKHASAAVPGWPVVVLGRQKDQHVHTLPLDTYLKSFQDEVVAFQSYLSFGGLPDCGAPLVLDPYTCLANPNHDRTRKPRSKAARPATVKTRTYQIKQAAAALHHGGLGLDKLVGLADLVRPFSRAEEIANYYYDRAGQKPNSNCAGVLDLLRQIARYTGSSDEEIDKISSWLKQASPKHGGTMSAKNAGRLRQVVSKRNLAVLLHLPAELMKRARRSADPHEAARLALYATALEILSICPLRLSNLQGLRLGVHVQNLDARHGSRPVFSLGSSETKNDTELLWPIPDDSAALLREYVKAFRPSLADPGNDFLFPGKGDASRSINGMRDAIEKPCGAMGIKLNPHLMRHLAVWIYLKAHPGQYEAVRRILGHKRVETTIRFYAGLEAQFAAEMYDLTISANRKATKVYAQAAYNKMKHR